MNAADRSLQVREAVLGFMAPRQAFPYTLEQIVERVQRSGMLDFRPENDEVLSALTFLANFKPDALVKETRARLGATIYYQATSAGVLAFERGTLEESPQ